MVDSTYTSEDIKVLTDRDHVRMRTPVYLGNMNQTDFYVPLLSEASLAVQKVTFIPAVYKSIGEILDNCLDEFTQTSSKSKQLKITAIPAEGRYTILDNGRGVPIEKHSSGQHTPEVVFGSLRSGRNFTHDKQTGVQGMNGVGSACTNFCSSEFNVAINRDGQRYTQSFVDGASNVSPPVVTKNKKAASGTEISFVLDKQVFGDVSLPDVLIRNRAIEIALMNPDVAVEYNNEHFHFKRGLQEYIDNIASKKTTFKFDVSDEIVHGEIYVICDGHDGIDEQMFTWVNSSLLFDGGKCNTQFFNILFERVTSHLSREAKRLKAEITRNDIRKGLLVLANLKIKNPEYDSQSKTRLTGPDLRKELTTTVSTNWKAFARGTNDWLADVLTRANERHHRDADKKAINDHEKNKRKKISVPSLLDATSKNRFECQILLTEGLSAKSQISEAREPTTTAAYALTGKINNTWGASPAQVLKMGKLTELLAVIGLTPGRKVDRSSLNYGKIIIATDADQDGSDIFTLLICLLFQYWPELFDPGYAPVVYRLVAPNVVASKGDKRVHFTTMFDYDKAKDKYKGWTIEYMKGLGSMSKQDWEMVLSGKSDTYLPIVDDGNMIHVLELLFGPSSDMRKAWLMANG